MNSTHKINYKPNKMGAWLKSTEAYQIFIVRAFRHRFSRGMYFISTIFLTITVVILLESINPVLDLEEMEVTTGIVEQVTQAARTSCGDRLVLRISDERTMKFEVCLNEKEGKSILGQKVKVWSQRRVSIFGTIDYIYQIQSGKSLLLDYKKIKSNRLTLLEKQFWIITTFAFFSIIPLLYVWQSNKRN